MHASIARDAAKGVSQTHTDPNDAPLAREDQAALELGFPPTGGLRWRRRRVEQLRERIDHGTYEVDAARVAGALVARLQGVS